MRTLLFALTTLTMVFVGLQAPSATQNRPSPKGQTRRLYVGVVDQAGSPVLDLGPNDFDITEGGTARTVVRAGLATSPMRIALLVDTGDAASAALPHVRAGLTAFLDTLPPEHEVMLVTTGRQVRVRVQPTTDRKKLRDAAGALFPDGAGTVLMDGLLEIDDRFMRKAEDRWPVFVIVTSDGTESSAAAHEKEFNAWSQGLSARGTTAHALVLKVKGSGVPEMVAMGVTRNTGGRYDMMNTSNALPDKLRALATQLGADHRQMSVHYQLEYVTDSTTQAPVNVGVARSGVKLQTSYRRQFP
jgi:hypothetical protein